MIATGPQASREARSDRAGDAACGWVSALYSVLPPRTLSKVSMRKAMAGHYTASRRRAALAPLSPRKPASQAARSGRRQHRLRSRTAFERQLQVESDEAGRDG